MNNQEKYNNCTKKIKEDMIFDLPLDIFQEYFDLNS